MTTNKLNKCRCGRVPQIVKGKHEHKGVEFYDYTPVCECGATRYSGTIQGGERLGYWTPKSAIIAWNDANDWGAE